jgi:hypothetical protein
MDTFCCIELNALCLFRYEANYEVDFWKTLFQSTINFNYVENGKLEQMHYKIQTSNFNVIQKMCFCQTHLQLTSMEYGVYEICHGKAQK